MTIKMILAPGMNFISLLDFHLFTKSIMYKEDGEPIDSADPFAGSADPFAATTIAHVKFDYDNGLCGISTSADDTHIYYEGILYGKFGDKNDVISREKLINMPIKCDFSKELTVSVEDFFKPLVRNDYI